MKALLAFALLAPLATAVVAQDAPSQAPPSFKAGVELVRLDVRVTDASGGPVRDLKQSEIEVEEDGHSRPVVFFQHVEEPTESYAEVASHTVAGEVSTNQGAARGHLYVIVFDQQHLAPGNEQRAREAAQRFLQTRVRPGDRVALFTLPGPGPQVGFTANARRVAAELAGVRGLAQPLLLGPLAGIRVDEAFQIARGNEAVLRTVSERLQAERESDTKHDADSSPTAPLAIAREDALGLVKTVDTETRRMLALLRDVMRQMREIEGRKSVLFISEGFYDDNVTRDLEDVAAAAAQSYSVIYAIDVNRRGSDLTANEPAASDRATGILDRVNPLAGLAAETDGLFANDAGLRVDQIFAAVAAQSQDYYLVGFAPRDEAVKDPGRYRRVKVRVHRSGATVSTRTGYALVDPASRLDRRQAIDRALAAPFPQQGLPVEYTTYQLRGAAQGVQRVIMSLAAELPLASERQARSADVVFIVRAGSDGRIVTSGTDTIALPEHRGSAATTTGTATYRVQFELAPGDYIMRAVVREPGGLVGSADRRFTVRALDGPALATGDLILSSSRGELAVRPTAFTGDGLSGVLALYGRTADQIRNAKITVDLVPIGQQRAVTSGSADLQEPQTISGGVTREARIELPLQSVAPGAYLVRARVIVGTDTAAQLVREVEVRDGRRPAVAEESISTASVDPREIANGVLARQFATRLQSPSSPSSVAALKGLERLAAADYPSAIAAFQTSLAATPPKEEGATAFFLGWSYHGAGDDRQAITAWRRAAFVDPSIVPVHLALADVYVRLSQPALAIQALRAGLAALPGSPELIDRLSRLEPQR
jgi:VWFA-related protein